MCSKFVEGLDGLVDEFYPKHRVEYFDLTTGITEPELMYYCYLDPVVVNWVNDSNDRWLAISNKRDHKNPRFFGARGEPD